MTHVLPPTVADALRAAGPAMQRSFGGRTGDQARTAFEKIADKAHERSVQMNDASEALASAGHEGGKAQQAYHGLGPEPTEPAPPEDPAAAGGAPAPPPPAPPALPPAGRRPRSPGARLTTPRHPS